MAQEVTATTIIGDAFGILNVYMPGESMNPNDAQFARRALNDLLSEYGNQTLMTPIIARLRFDLVANQGSTSNPYTIGPGGDFDTSRPSNQDSLTQANLILTNTTPETRVPLQLVTDTASAGNPVPDTQATQPIALYYNPTYDGDLGSIELWPVPTTGDNDLELFVQQAVPAFADLSTLYWLPDGFARVLKYNLALTLSGTFGKTISPMDAQIAVSSLGVFRRANVKINDVVNDASGIGHASGVYNILSDTFTR